MKYSILFLNYDPEEKLSDISKENLYRIVKNSRGQDYEIMVLDRPGVNKDLNRGFRESRGDYIVIFSNDIVLDDPNWLNVLAVPDTITSFKSTVSKWDNEMLRPELDASMSCYPRSVWNKVGEWDEDFDGGYGYADNDFFYRAWLAEVPLQEVSIKLTHLTSATYNAYNMKGEAGIGFNHDLILKKHKLGNYKV